MQIPSALLEAFRAKNGALFVGAGASVAAGLPDWTKLVQSLAVELSVPYDASKLLRIAQYYENEFNRPTLIRKIQESMPDPANTPPTSEKLKKVGPIHDLLAQLPIRLYYTTNFDTYLETALEAHGISFDVIPSEVIAKQVTLRRRCQIRKLHGSIINQDWNDVVITHNDFSCLSNRRPVLFQELASDLRSHTFLFVGYSLQDPDFNGVYDWLIHIMAGKLQNHFVALTTDPGPHEVTFLKRQCLMPIAVWRWPGNDETEKLCHFLISLRNATSEQYHIRRFYGRLGHDDKFTIVTSSYHNRQRLSYKPDCDMRVANQVSTDLKKISVSSDIISDVEALGRAEELRVGNIILVCGPSANRFTKYIYDSARQIAQSFTLTGDRSHRAIVAGSQEFRARDPDDSYALIARYPNPWSHGKYIFVFFGLHGPGTEAIGHLLKQPDAYERMTKDSKEKIMVILPVRCSGHRVTFEPEIPIG